MPNQEPKKSCEFFAPKVFIRTFGCQMNDRDSEEIIGMLLEKGYVLSDSPEDADVVLFNTCSVRKHAEDRAISNIGALQALKKKRPQMIIGVVGCMAKAQKEKLLEKLPHVDFIAAPANIYEVPEMIDEIVTSNKSQVTSAAKRTRYSAVDGQRRAEIRNIAYHTKGLSALVTIMEGCNNFCSYCIVPYVRGREVGRPAEDIIDEIKALADKGYKEAILLGQNVNSYRGPEAKVLDSSASQEPALSVVEGARPQNDGSGTSSFVKLLERINDIGGIERIRFLTSHPKDAGKDLFKAMRDLSKVCEHLHLPLQSGSDKILKSMNRGYSADEYLRKIDSLREHVPDCALSTDIIVGYPGETEEDFEATRRLMKRIGFNSAFIFKYSPRWPAKSSELKDDVSGQVKAERNRILLELQERISSRKEREFFGSETEVLTEEICRKDKEKVMGRNRQNIKVALRGDEKMIGKLAKVRVKGVKGHTLMGEMILSVILFCFLRAGIAKAATVDEYFVKGDYENAAREAGRALSSSTKDSDRTYYFLATSLNKLGRYETARENFQALIDKYPRSSYAPLAQLGIADSYFLNSDYLNANASYEKYIEKYPRSESAALAYFRLAKCAQKLGKWQVARNYYQKVKGEFPFSFEAQLSDKALSEEILYFTVQVGSFGKKANAIRLCDELIKKGYDASILKSENEGRDFYKVRVGRLNRKEDAEELAKRLQAEGLSTNILP